MESNKRRIVKWLSINCEKSRTKPRSDSIFGRFGCIIASVLSQWVKPHYSCESRPLIEAPRSKRAGGSRMNEKSGYRVGNRLGSGLNRGSKKELLFRRWYELGESSYAQPTCLNHFVCGRAELALALRTHYRANHFSCRWYH